MSKKKLEKPRASLYPVPVTLVTCFDGTNTNIITISWTGIMCSVPPIIYISVRPERHSYKLISESNRFCMNIPGRNILSEVDYCGNTSGAFTDKSKACNFDLITLADGYPKAIQQCKHHLFCDVVSRIELGSHDVFIAEVKFEFIDEDCYSDNHSFNYEAIEPIAYCRKDYYSLTERIGTYGKEKEAAVMNEKEIVTILYTNYKGKTALRKIIPKNITFAHNEWHTEDQWLMTAFDLEKAADRTFAMKDIKAWYTE